MITPATVEQSAAFLDAYQRARRVAWTEAESRGMAGGGGVLAFDAKKSLLAGYEAVTGDNIAGRLRLGGA
jgi:hypothetical protein